MSWRRRWRRWWRKIPRKKSRVLWRTERVILRGADMSDLREKVYIRAEGRCEILTAEGKRCNVEAAWEGWQHGELYHERHRSLGGSDTLENTKWACFHCHRARHLGPQWSTIYE